MKLDVRNFLKQVKDLPLPELEKVFEEAIEEGRKHSDERYDESPILAWMATKKVTSSRGAMVTPRRRAA